MTLCLSKLIQPSELQLPDVPSCNYLRGHGYLVVDNAFSIPGPASFGEVVDGCKLYESRENKGVAHSDKPVHGSSVGHFGQGVTGTDTQSGHGKDCGHTWMENKHTVHTVMFLAPLFLASKNSCICPKHLGCVFSFAEIIISVVFFDRVAAESAL